MFFIIGLSGIDVTKEIELNDDIIIGEFEDNYENLALKTMLGYQYSINYCSSGKGFNRLTDVRACRSRYSECRILDRN